MYFNLNSIIQLKTDSHLCRERRQGEERWTPTEANGGHSPNKHKRHKLARKTDLCWSMFKHQMPVCHSHWNTQETCRLWGLETVECSVLNANWKIIGEVAPDMLCVEKIAKQKAKNGNIQRAKHQNPNQKSSPRRVGRKEN